MPAARTEPDRADLAGGAGQRAQMIGRSFEILHRLGVRQTEHDREHRLYVVRFVARRGANKGRAPGVVADIGEPPGDVAMCSTSPKASWITTMPG